MKRNYSIYKLEDFVQDDDFIRWVTNPSRESNLFWESFLLQNTHQAETMEQARNIVIQLATPIDTPFSIAEKREIWQTIESHLQPRETSSYTFVSWKKWMVAACLLLGTFLLFIGKQYPLLPIAPEAQTAASSSDQLELINRSSHQEEHWLPDGTKVVLSANSSLHLDKYYNLTSREVELKGEAFFDVVRNQEKPFIVRSNDLITEVLGTSFLISAWQDDRYVSVKVKTGLVTLYTDHGEVGPPQDPIFLKPDQQANYAKNEKVLFRQTTIQGTHETVQSNPYIGELTFTNKPVSDVLKAISSEYNVMIHYDSSKLSSCFVTTTLLQDSLLQQLDIICEAIDASYQIIDGEIILEKATNCS